MLFVLGSQWRTIISNWIDRQIANCFRRPVKYTLHHRKTCFKLSVTAPHRCCGRCNGRNLKCLLFSLHSSGQEEITPTLERKTTLALGPGSVSGCKETKCLLFSSPTPGPHSVVQSHWLRPGKLHSQLHVQHGYLGTAHRTSAMVLGNWQQHQQQHQRR